jgi:hypothetical protein
LEGKAMAILDAFIDLQVFHLQRAAALLAHSKQHKLQKVLALQHQQPPPPPQQQQQQRPAV